MTVQPDHESPSGADTITYQHDGRGKQFLIPGDLWSVSQSVTCFCRERPSIAAVCTRWNSFLNRTSNEGSSFFENWHRMLFGVAGEKTKMLRRRNVLLAYEDLFFRRVYRPYRIGQVERSAFARILNVSRIPPNHCFSSLFQNDHKKTSSVLTGVFQAKCKCSTCKDFFRLDHCYRRMDSPKQHIARLKSDDYMTQVSLRTCLSV
jgi:hypothetical protein